MMRAMNKLSLRQTINHVVYEMNEPTHENVPSEDFSWRDIVQKCMEVRQDRLLAAIPDLTITESQPSMCLEENLFSDIETGRDATQGEFSDHNLILDCPSVIKSPRKNSVDRPTTLIEEVPDSPCSSASSSSYSLPHASPLNSPTSVGSKSPHSPVQSPLSLVPSSAKQFSKVNEEPGSRPKRLCSSSSSSYSLPHASLLNSPTPVGSKSPHSPVQSSFSRVRSSAQQFSELNEKRGSRPKRPCSSSSSSYSLPHASPLNAPSRSILEQSQTASPNMKSTSPLPDMSTKSSPNHSSARSRQPPSKSRNDKLDKKVLNMDSSRPKRKLAGRRLQTWRGEHPIYKPTEDGCFTIEGFTIPRPPDAPKRKKGKAKVGKPILKKIDLSESLIQNSDMTREKMKNNLKSLQNLNWKKSKTTDQIEHAVITRDKENGLVVGMFRFIGKCEKPAQKTSNYTTNYTLLKGLVSIKIGDEPYMIINELESLSIPGLTSYSMKNLIEGESILQFHVVSSAL